MSEQPIDALLVPEPTPVPAEQQLTSDQILDFDPAATVAASQAPDGDTGLPPAPMPAETPVMPAPEPPSARAEAACPSCGTVGVADFARRDAGDFCAVCDYPLFWSRDRVVLPSNDAPDDSGLRRLPGTAGRAALASLLCPTCAEPNPATGVTCVRCGSDLHPKPVVAPVVEAPLPVVEVEPEPAGRPWWPIILAGALALVALAVVLVIVYT